MSNRRTKKKKYRGGKIPMVDDELYVFSKYNVIYRGNIINNYDTNKPFVRLDEETYTFMTTTNNEEIQNALNNLSINDNISHLDLFDYKIELPFESNEDLDLNYMAVFHDNFVDREGHGWSLSWANIIVLLMEQYLPLMPELVKFFSKSDRNPFNFQVTSEYGMFNIDAYTSLSAKYNLLNKYTFSGNFYKLLVALLNPKYNNKNDVSQWIELEKDLIDISPNPTFVPPNLTTEKHWRIYQKNVSQTDSTKKQAFVNLCDLMALFYRYTGANQNDETTRTYFISRLNGNFTKDLNNYTDYLLAEIYAFYELKQSLFAMNDPKLDRTTEDNYGNTIQQLDTNIGVSSMSFVILFYIYERLKAPILTMGERSMDLFPMSKLNFVNDLTQNKFVYNPTELGKIATNSEIMSFKYPKKTNWKATYKGKSFSGCCERGVFELIKFISAGENQRFYVDLLPPNTLPEIKTIIENYPTFEIMKANEDTAFNKFVEVVSDIPQLSYRHPNKYELRSIYGMNILKYIFSGDVNSSENIVDMMLGANRNLKIEIPNNSQQLQIQNSSLYFFDKLIVKFIEGHTSVQYILTKIPEERVMRYRLISNYILNGIVRNQQSGMFNVMLENLNVSKVTDMKYLFANYESFNQPLGKWDTSNVTNMSYMFQKCKNFNQPLNSWNTINVIDMGNMFDGCDKFNQSLNNWDTSKVKIATHMFHGCISFNQQLDRWNTSNIITMEAMFSNCGEFNQPLNSWNVSKVKNMANMFNSCFVFNQPLNSWNTGSVTDMSSMFAYCYKFNQQLGSWDTHNVMKMESMFYKCSSFNQPLNDWNVSKVNNMLSMFDGCKRFNQRLDLWDVSGVVDFRKMFYGCKSYDQNLSSWNKFVAFGRRVMVTDMFSNIPYSNFVKTGISLPSNIQLYFSDEGDDDESECEKKGSKCNIMGGKKKTRKIKQKYLKRVSRKTFMRI